MLICQKQALRWILPLTIYIHRGMRASKLLVCSLESSGEGGGGLLQFFVLGSYAYSCTLVITYGCCIIALTQLFVKYVV